jgi:hypothetical protein
MKKLRGCPSCERTISAEHVACPYCGVPLAPPPQRDTARRLVYLMMGLTLLVALSLVWRACAPRQVLKTSQLLRLRSAISDDVTSPPRRAAPD